MMKYVFNFMLSLLLFAACGDEVRENGIDVAPSYSGDNLELQFNGKPLEGKTVGFVFKNQGKAAVSFAFLLPGEEATVIEGTTVEHGGVLSLEGENVTANRKVSMTGEIRGEKLKLAVNVEIYSKIVGRWKLPPANDVDDDPLNNAAIYIDFSNHVVDTVRLPNLLANGNVDENKNPIYDYPYIVPVRDTVDKYGRPEDGFPKYVMTGLLTNYYSYLLKELEFMPNGEVKVNYDFGFSSDTKAFLEGRIRYGIVNGQLWMVSDSPAGMPEKGLPFQLSMTPSLMKISVTKELLDTFAILSSHIQKLINYQNSNNMIRPGKTTEKSVRQFVEVEMVNLIRTSEWFECGVNLIPVP